MDFTLPLDLRRCATWLVGLLICREHIVFAAIALSLVDTYSPRLIYVCELAWEVAPIQELCCREPVSPKNHKRHIDSFFVQTKQKSNAMKILKNKGTSRKPDKSTNTLNNRKTKNTKTHYEHIAVCVNLFVFWAA